MNYLGDFTVGKTIRFPFQSFNASGASSATTGFAAADIKVYKNGSTTERSSTNGYTATADFDTLTGINLIAIDTSDNTDAGFFAAGNDYIVVVGDVTIDTQTVRFVAGCFSLENRVKPTKATRQPYFRLQSGVTDKYVYFTAYDSTDHTTQKTGLSSFTAYRSRNGGTATAYTTPTVTEVSSSNMPGVYKFLVDEDTTLAAGAFTEMMTIYVTASGMDPVEIPIELFRRDVDAPTKGVALSDIPFFMVDAVDHVTAKTGLTITAQVSKDAGAFAAAAGTAAEVGNGIYQFDATAADMTADVVVFRFTGTGADPTLVSIKTVV